MAIKYLSSLNLNNNELQNAAVHVLSSAPTSPAPVEGQIYYNNTAGDKKLYIYNGTSFNAVDGTAVATSAALGSLKLFSDTEQSVAATSVSATAARTYGVQLNSDSRAVVNVPWVNTTYSAATTTTPGLIELEDATVQTVAANTVTATTGRTYGLQVNSDGQGVINVPWTDTVYTHPSYTNGLVESIDINTGTLTGATVISGLLIDIVTDTLGHVTSVNAGAETRTLTLANLGYTGATNANYITNNNQLTNGANFITSAGNAATVTTNANLTGVVTSTGNATAIADAALSIAKTNGLQTALNAKAALASPALSGTPTAPTAAAATNTTQIATTAFVRAEVAALVGTAGETLDTLGEIATALGNNASLSTTLTNSIGTKVTSNTAITAGTGTKVTYDTKGLVTSSTTLAATDIPVLSTTKLTTGILPVLRGGTGVATSTGTGSTVLSTSPVLTTPNIGSAIGSISGNAATATNVAYSGLTGTVPTWNQSTTGNAATATRADSIAGGLGGSIPYKTGVSTTALLANGSAGQVLQSNGGTAAPTWVTRTKSYNLVHASGTAVSGSVASNGNKTWTITHGMGASLLYMVQVIQISGTGAGETVFTNVTRTTTEVIVTFNTAPTSGEYTVVIVKI